LLFADCFETGKLLGLGRARRGKIELKRLALAIFELFLTN